MEKFIAYFLIILMLGCNNPNNNFKEHNLQIKYISIGIYPSLNDNDFNIFIDLSSGYLIVQPNKPMSRIPAVPPDKDSKEPYVTTIEQKIKLEVISLNKVACEDLNNGLKLFKQNDLATQINSDVKDGTVIIMDFIYNENKYQRIELINNSTTTQSNFLNLIKSILIQQSRLNIEFFKDFFK